MNKVPKAVASGAPRKIPFAILIQSKRELYHANYRTFRRSKQVAKEKSVNFFKIKRYRRTVAPGGFATIRRKI